MLWLVGTGGRWVWWINGEHLHELLLARLRVGGFVSRLMDVCVRGREPSPPTPPRAYLALLPPPNKNTICHIGSFNLVLPLRVTSAACTLEGQLLGSIGLKHL